MTGEAGLAVVGCENAGTARAARAAKAIFMVAVIKRDMSLFPSTRTDI